MTAMLDPLALIEQFAGKAGLAEGTLMFCGTLAAHGGVRPAEIFEFELDDPVLGAQNPRIATASAICRCSDE